MPHKRAAHDLADELTAAAAAIGAANTLTFDGGRIEADNTDAGGLPRRARRRSGRLALPGARRRRLGPRGRLGAARGRRGEVSIWNRTAERAASWPASSASATSRRPEAADLVVNCTSVGLDARVAVATRSRPLAWRAVDPPHAFFDLVYGAEPTPLAALGSRRWRDRRRGLEMLVRQGARSLERWTGQAAPLEVMRAGAA